MIFLDPVSLDTHVQGYAGQEDDEHRPRTVWKCGEQRANQDQDGLPKPGALSMLRISSGPIHTIAYGPVEYIVGFLPPVSYGAVPLQR